MKTIITLISIISSGILLGQSNNVEVIKDTRIDALIIKQKIGKHFFP